MSNELKKVTWFNNNNKSLVEIYQKTGFVYAFAKPTENGFEMCHEWIKCRDFLHDVVRTQLTTEPSTIYGFKFTKDNPSINLKKIMMIVSAHKSKDNTPDKFREKIKFAIKTINHFEKYAKMSLSTVQEVDANGSGKEVVFLFTGSATWLSSPVLISMYTMLIRLGDKLIEADTVQKMKEKLKEISLAKEDGSEKDSDVAYLQDLWDKLHIILKNRAVLFTKKGKFHDIFYKKCEIGMFHNYSGILSLATFATHDRDLNDRMRSLYKEVSETEKA